MIIDKKINILVVDDFSTMIRIVTNLLKELGFINIDSALDGSIAWPMIQTGKYDFIVSDWNMPEMTGIELLRLVRKDPQFSDMPFMLITAEQKRSQILEAAQAGVDGYIVKPFTAATMKEKIDKIAERKSLEKRGVKKAPPSQANKQFAAQQQAKLKQMLAAMSPEKRAAYLAKLKREQKTG
ncbi:MAG: response regulator [Gammaproteobacteria bacterium]|nr:response regulator [Gammaproteobacteria bacterium]